MITYADGSSSPAAETDSYYDQTTPASPPTAPVQHVSAPGGTARGNLTTVVKQCFGCAANPTTTYAYYNTGQVTQMTDPNGNPTGFSYTDNYSSCGGSAPPSGSSMAYLTQVTYPSTNGVAHVVSFCYDYIVGLLRSSTDGNSQVTSYKYNDSLDRLTETDYPDGGQTLVSYNDAPPSPTLTVQKKLNASGQYATNITVTNGLGLPTETELTSDPQGTDYTSTTYDGLGRAYQVTNPYRSTSDPTYGVTTYNYDSLGRVTQVTHPDSSTVLSEHIGRATEVQDEGNGTSRVTRISQADALGRLISVCEVSGGTQMGTSGTPGSCGQDIAATGFLTTYSYDALDNLASVNQPGLGTRTFSYNSLFELTSVTNPENGTISYSYDANGNVMTKTAPAPNQTGSATVTTSYQYDALNRVTQKSYSDGTPTVQFGYDTATMTIGSLQVQATNPVGRLSWEATSPYPASFTQSSFSYDPMGRINEHWSCQNVSCSHSILWLSYTYDSLGDELTRTLNGNTHAATYDTAGRLTSYTQTNYTNPTNPANLLTGVTYDPFGHMTFANFGNGLSQSWAYDNRGRVTALAAGTGCTAGMGTCTNTKYSYTVGYAPDGDILSANDSINGNWAYAYDAFNRLAAASCSVSAPMTCPDGSATEGFTYAYDQYGNMWHGDGSLSVSYSGGNNRIDGYNYDTAGDLLNDGNHSYSYDAENRIATVDGGATSYFYDAEGRRLEKTENGTPLFDYFYDRTGHVSLVVETIGGSPYPFYGEEYAGGLHLASHVLNAAHNGTDTYFHHNDWLGTERARTDMTGNLCETVSSLPFGDNQNISTTCAEGDVSPMHFTGKQRDNESGNDYFGARYYGSGSGRFTTPDPINLTPGRLIDPQTLNKYSYGRNAPTLYVDPTGRDITVFYRAPSGAAMDFGHIMLAVTNQATGSFRLVNYYNQNGHSASGPGVNGPVTAEDLKAYAALTIRTSPEVAHELIKDIDALTHDAPAYTFPFRDCATVCADLLHAAGVEAPSLLASPTDIWSMLYSRYSAEALKGGQLKMGFYRYQPGRDFGSSMSAFPNGTDPFYNLQLLRLLLAEQNEQAAPRACVESADDMGNMMMSCD